MDIQQISTGQQKLLFCQQDIQNIISRIDSFRNELPSAWRGPAASRFQNVLMCQRNQLEILSSNLSSLVEIERQINAAQALQGSIVS